MNKVDNNILKLDSVVPETVALLNVPNSKSFTVDKLISNLKKFNGNLIIQTLFGRGIHNGHVVDNTTEKEVEGWIRAIQEIKPRQVMIYAIDRETPEKNLEKLSKDELEKIADKVRILGYDVTVSV